MFSPTTLDLVREHADIRSVFEEAGVRLRGRSNLLGRCPFHGDRSPSLSVSVAKGVFYCFGCEASGDAIEAYQRLHDVRFPDAVRELAARFGVLLDQQRPASRRYRPLRYVPPPPVYPPEEQINALARYCRPVTDDGEAAEYLRYRGIDPAVVAARRLAFALRADAPSCVVPHHRPDDRGVRPWTETHHRLIVPMYDARGVRRNVVARSVELLPARKTAVQGTCVELAFANEGGLQFLRGEPAALPPADGSVDLEWPIRPASALAARTIVIAEGEIDFLNVATERDDFAAVFSVRAGSWTQAHADRLPDGAHVVIATDDDEAGGRYAETIAGSLATRIRSGALSASRWRPTH